MVRRVRDEIEFENQNESVKAASDVYAPIGGKVKSANDELSDTPETVNEDPEGKGWFVQLVLSDASELDGLMDKDSYDKFCEGL